MKRPNVRRPAAGWPRQATRRRRASRPSRSAPRPFVLVNMAMTADGKIATANRAVSSIGSARDHEQLLALRATADAVMAGARTVDLNPINLGPGPARYRRRRRGRGLREYNLRVVVSGRGSVRSAARIFSWERGRGRRCSPLLVVTTRRAGRTRVRRLQALADEVKEFGRAEVNFKAALRWLRERWGVNRLLCEGGGELNDALFRADLVDELHLTLCPKIFGGRRAPTIAEGKGFARLAAARRFKLESARRLGDELFLVLTRDRGRRRGRVATGSARGRRRGHFPRTSKAASFSRLRT
jgi:2,5-diamino-6-(ribosylamino)-4(3H)-pyrimidinone 5'-phosphate reductase